MIYKAPTSIKNPAGRGHLVPFLSYLTLNNIVTLKSGLKVFHGHSNY